MGYTSLHPIIYTYQFQVPKSFLNNIVIFCFNNQFRNIIKFELKMSTKKKFHNIIFFKLLGFSKNYIDVRCI